MREPEPAAATQHPSTESLTEGPPTEEALTKGPLPERNAQDAGILPDRTAQPGPAAEPAAEAAPAAEPDPASPGPEELRDLWAQVQEALGRRVQREQFETWFRRASLIRLDDQEVVIAVLNTFALNWLKDYYSDTLEQAVHAVLGVRRRIRLTVDPELAVPPAAGGPLPDTGESGASNTPAAPSTRPPLPGDPGGAELPADDASRPGPTEQGGPEPPRMLGPAGGLLWNSDVVLNPKYTFENFVVGPCNRFGHAAAMGAGEQPGKHYNPFFLHGRVGVGKTHLLQAVCFSILSRWNEARILYLSCETFVNHFIAALENGDLAEFRNKYRQVDVLVVDDIHLLANKERTQEEFFHTFNTLYNAGKQIVLSSDSPPKDIPTLQDRLVSRFKWGMVTEIEPPCYETRMAIVKRKSRERGTQVPDEVAQLIAEHVDENVRELEGAVTRLIGYSSLTGKPITLELAREGLADLLHVRRGAPSMEDIVQEVTQYFGVKLSELQSKKRTKSIAFPRQVAMYLARKLTRHSLEEIGGWFGGRDHSTVLYAVDRIGDRLTKDATCKQAVEDLLGRLQGGLAS